MKKMIRTEMYVECPVCRGSGEVVNPTFEACCREHQPDNMEEAYRHCPYHINGRCECGPELIECPTCEGTGWVKSGEEVVFDEEEYQQLLYALKHGPHKSMSDYVKTAIHFYTDHLGLNSEDEDNEDDTEVIL